MKELKMKKIFALIFMLFVSFSFNAFGQTDVLSEVFKILNNDYINNISNKDIALKGLGVLSKTSPDTGLKETSKKLVLYHKGKLIRQFILPEKDDDIKAWVDLCEQIMLEATKNDENIAAKDFKLPDLFATSVFEGLDGYSHYFSGAEDDTKPLKIRRPFASRIIDNILLIRMLNFKKGISQKVKSAVEECLKCEALILDLRNNHGGFLQEAIKIADMFLDEGIITYTVSGEGGEPKYYTAPKGDIFDGKPIVILTDSLTASAAEVLAAALSEQNRAVLIGTKTYGKGTVQEAKKMDKDRAVSLTTSFFYTPSGIKIDKVGLTPFICVGENNDCTPSDRFIREEDIDLAVKYLKTGSID